MTLREMAEKAARDIPHHGGPAHPTSEIADAIERVARRFAERALSRWLVVRYGEWWKPEGHTFRVIDAIPSVGPSGSPAFATKEAAETHTTNLIAAAIAAAERGE